MTSLEPQLAPPGAGLPKVELFIARMLFGVRRLTGSRRSFDAAFLKERELIRALIARVDPECGARRILIERPVGLEDSSRNWSVWMTLDHLRIVHTSFGRIIRALVAGIVPEGKADTAAVKPRPDVTAEIVDPYEKSCDELLTIIADRPNLKTTVRYAHPWFGPLDAAGWHALCGTHLCIHRVQIERIVAGLTAAGR